MERLRPETTFDEVGLLMVLPERRGDSFSRWCRVLCLESWDSDMVKRVAASTSEIAKGLANGLTEANAEQKDLMRRIYEETLENGVCFRITPGGLKKKLFGGDSGRLVTRREVKEKIGWSMDRFKMDVSRVKGNAGGWRETTVVSILTSSFFIKSKLHSHSKRNTFN